MGKMLTKEGFEKMAGMSGAITRHEAEMYTEKFPKPAYDEWDDLMAARKLFKGNMMDISCDQYDAITRENDTDDYERNQGMNEFPILDRKTREYYPWMQHTPT